MTVKRPVFGSISSHEVGAGRVWRVPIEQVRMVVGSPGLGDALCRAVGRRVGPNRCTCRPHVHTQRDRQAAGIPRNQGGCGRNLWLEAMRLELIRMAAGIPVQRGAFGSAVDRRVGRGRRAREPAAQREQTVRWTVARLERRRAGFSAGGTS